MIVDIAISNTFYGHKVVEETTKKRSTIKLGYQVEDDAGRPTTSDMQISLSNLDEDISFITAPYSVVVILQTATTGFIGFSGYLRRELTYMDADDLRYDITAMSTEAQIIQTMKTLAYNRAALPHSGIRTIWGRRHRFSDARLLVGYVAREAGCNWIESQVVLPNDWIYGGSSWDNPPANPGVVTAYDIINGIASAYNAVWGIDQANAFWMMPKEDMFDLKIAEGIKTLYEVEDTVNVLSRDLAYDRVQLKWSGSAAAGEYMSERLYSPGMYRPNQKVKTHQIKLSYAPIEVPASATFYDFLLRPQGLSYVSIDPFDATYPHGDPFFIESRGVREFESDYCFIDSPLTSAQWLSLIGGYSYIAKPTEAPAGKFFIRSFDLEPGNDIGKVRAIGYDI